ncbi:THAP domain-containing protein 2-like [Argiope bruennichi]|uniref:THAP domain-containing protein 2-like n=1 Tax=Argiope bruennichi TaxID=94029 RepID=UPI00249581F5|nr:THAP domain-containing protein 2-like [Argiope bruennichi]
MPFTCCVPNCKGNYKTGPKVSVFNFPKDGNLRKRWIATIHRKDFEPSKVCELHFVEDDFVKEARGLDINTGKVLTAPLGIKKLKEEAFPTVFCGYPNYFQVPKNQRDCSEEKREEREQSALIQAIENSIKENEIYEKWSFGSLEELDLKCRSINLLTDILSTCVKVFEEEPKDDVLNSVKDALQIMMHSDKDPFF